MPEIEDLYQIKKGDTSPPLEAFLTQNKKPAPLAGADVRFYMKPAGGGPGPEVDAEAFITDEDAGKVEHRWSVGDTDVPGLYFAEFEATFAPGTPNETVQTFPNNGYINVEVVADLGPPPGP